MPCGYGVQKKQLPLWKTEDDHLKQPASQQLQEVVKEYHGAIKSFFEKRKKGDQDCRQPSFRKSGSFYPQHFPQRYNSFEIEGSTLKVAFGSNRKTWLSIPLKKADYSDINLSINALIEQFEIITQ